MKKQKNVKAKGVQEKVVLMLFPRHGQDMAVVQSGIGGAFVRVMSRDDFRGIRIDGLDLACATK